MGTETSDGNGREIAGGNEVAHGFPFPSRPHFAVPAVTASPGVIPARILHPGRHERLPTSGGEGAKN